MTLRFEDPSPRQGYCPPGIANRRTQILAALNALREHPDRWAVIAVYELRSTRAAQQLSWQIRNGRAGGSRPAGAFDATSRIVGDEVRLYARYLGGAQ